MVFLLVWKLFLVYQVKMQFLKSLLVLISLSASVYASPFARRNTTGKRYAILDNDWSTAGFIPFLLALDAGIKVLALTSCLLSLESRPSLY